MLALCAAAAILAADPCVAYDDKGQGFATCFDPGNGLNLRAGAQARNGTSTTSFAASAEILVRTERNSRSKQGSMWFNEHRLLATTVQPIAGQRFLETTLYRGTYRRHVAQGFILIPTARPIRLPFPFDTGITVEVGRFERRVFEGAGWSLETLRAAALLDAARSADGRLHLAFGPALSHTVRYDGVRYWQEISPHTSGLIDLGWESAEGLWSMHLLGIAGYVFDLSDTRPTGILRVRAEAGIDRVLLAINDTPLSLSLRGSYVHSDAGVNRGSEWTATAGLSFRAWGRSTAW